MSVTAAPGLSAAQRKLLLEANRELPSLVDVSRARHRGPGRRRGDSGPAAPQVLRRSCCIRRSCCTRPVPWGSQWRDPGQRQQSAPPPGERVAGPMGRESNFA